MSETAVMSPKGAVIQTTQKRPALSTRAPIRAPQSVADLGVPRKLLEDLTLKTVYLEDEVNLWQLAEKMGLSLEVVEDLFQRLRKEQLCEVNGLDAGSYRISLTSQAKVRAQECFSMDRYLGPAPVSLKDYVGRVREQSVKNVQLQFADVQRALASLVLTDDTLKHLGIAVLSGACSVLYGPTGTGKTTIAENIPDIYGDSVWIPYAVEVDSQIITVYDPALHRPLDGPVPEDSDTRWKLCRRPRVVVGGELTMEMLDLQFNPATGLYAAPLQMRANNGVLIVDDFGRQRIRPEELLNRWIVPLDRRIDFLTLAGGKKIEIPFELLVVFATNLDPAELGDEAFLRRIQNKILIGNVSSEQFHKIFREVCSQFLVAYDAAVVDHLIQVLRTDLNQPLRPSYARDLVQRICLEARFEGKQSPLLDWATVTRACHNYFLTPKRDA